MKTLFRSLLTLCLALHFGLAFAESEAAAEKKKFHINEVFSTEKNPEIKKKSRLRFKSEGPTCMCTGGLTEKDIKKHQSEHVKQ